jgi:type II secretory pathway component GspD/PulD (secretin)
MARSLKPGPDARVVADPRTNSIVLAGPESEVRLLERRIREADAP